MPNTAQKLGVETLPNLLAGRVRTYSLLTLNILAPRYSGLLISYLIIGLVYLLPLGGHQHA